MPSSGSGSATAAVSSGYPTADDLEDFLTGLGLTLSAAQQALLESAIDAGIQQFEGAGGVDRRMLAADETRYYDPPLTAGSLLLIDDFAAVDSVVYRPLNTDPTTLTLNLDYWLEPQNAPAKGKPYQLLRFRRSWHAPLPSGLRRSIEVAGDCGYATSIPAAARMGMLAAGALQLWTQITHAATGGLLSWKEKDRSEDYGVFPWTRLVDGWNAQYSSAVKTFKRWSL
jgi:hypothetical protein